MEAAQELLRRRRARRGLVDFACYVDPPAAPWYRAAHLQRIATALECALNNQELPFACKHQGNPRRLIINVQFRHWKSSIGSEKLPAYWLGQRNTDSIIIGSYAQSLPLKFSKTVRDLITNNERYRLLFPATRIARGSEAAEDWRLETGFRTSFRAVGTGGGVSGYGANLFLMDDVSDPNKAHSTTEYDNDWVWFKGVAGTRLEPEGVIVVIGQRTAVNDLTGKLTDREQNDSAFPPEEWTHVVFESENPDGSFIWEQRFGRDYYLALKRDTVLWRVQCLQKPTVEEGTEIKREWFEFVERLPDGVREQNRAVDTAWTLKKTEKADPDYTASIGSAVANNWLYLIDPFQERLELPDTVDWIKARKLATPWVRFGMAKAAGEAISRQFLERLGIPVEELEAESADLRVRLSVFIWWARNGKVKLVGDKQKWEPFLTQAAAFPHGKHDDSLAVCAGLTQMHNLTIETPEPRTPKPNIWRFAEK